MMNANDRKEKTDTLKQIAIDLVVGTISGIISGVVVWLITR